MSERQEESMKIESGIPIPRRGHFVGRGKWSILLDEMQEGDSVLLTEKQINSVRPIFSRKGAKITTRRVTGPDEEKPYYRLWLLKKPSTVKTIDK